MQEENSTQLVRGVIEEALPNAMFRVSLEEDGKKVLAYMAGKMRMNRIKVLLGDVVLLKIDPYGGKARIVRRI
jgi:translation initiation factor IF-1